MESRAGIEGNLVHMARGAAANSDDILVLLEREGFGFASRTGPAMANCQAILVAKVDKIQNVATVVVYFDLNNATPITHSLLVIKVFATLSPDCWMRPRPPALPLGLRRPVVREGGVDTKLLFFLLLGESQGDVRKKKIALEEKRARIFSPLHSLPLGVARLSPSSRYRVLHEATVGPACALGVPCPVGKPSSEPGVAT